MSCQPTNISITLFYRLYSEEDFAAFADYPTPEILRVPLDSLILQASDKLRY